MNKFLKVLAVAGLAIAAMAALPYKPDVSGTGPTTYESGDVLNPATDISGYNLYCDGSLFQGNIAPQSDGSLVFQIPKNALSVGDHACYATAIDVASAEGSATNTVNFTVQQDRPTSFTLLVQ